MAPSVYDGNQPTRAPRAGSGLGQARGRKRMDAVIRLYKRKASFVHIIRRATQARTRGAGAWVVGDVKSSRCYRPQVAATSAPTYGKNERSLRAGMVPAILNWLSDHTTEALPIEWVRGRGNLSYADRRDSIGILSLLSAFGGVLRQ